MLTLLLDTQVLIWLAQEPEKLPTSVEARLNADNKLFFSYASVWEMAIKIKTGKLSLAFPLEEFVRMALQKHVFELLPVSLLHIYYTQQIPLHHRDPFDRLLIAQSLTENIPVVSSDSAWDVYGVNRIWDQEVEKE